MNEYGYFWFYLVLFWATLQSALALFRRWRTESKGRLLAGNAAVLFFLLFALFLAGEGWFYFTCDATDGSLALLSSRRWVDRHVKVNNLGFRGKAPPKGVPRGTGGKRICVVGDSFAWGQGIRREEDRFPELLEAMLREGGGEVSVYNVNGAGWNTRQEAEILKLLRGTGFTFDMVVLAYVPNDIYDVREAPADYQRALKKSKPHHPVVNALINRSFVLSWLYHSLVTFRDPALRAYDRMVLDLYRRPDLWARHLADLGSIHDFCRGEGMDFAVVTFPMQEFDSLSS